MSAQNDAEDTAASRQEKGPSLSEAQAARLAQATEEYQAALDRGERPGREAFLERFPDIRQALAECLNGLEFLRSGLPGLRPAAQPGDPMDVTGAIPGEPLGDYRIVREIGRGGMGVVYEAEQLSLRRRVALKVLPLAGMLDPRQLARFRNEASAAAQLHHASIVPVYSVGCQRGVHYYAMQYIEGQSLAAVIRDLGTMAGMPATPPADGASEMSGVSRSVADGTWGASALAPPVGAPGAALEMTKTALGLIKGGSTYGRAFFCSVARLGIQAAEALEHAHQMGVVHRDVKPSNLLLDERGGLWVTDFGLASFKKGDLSVTCPGDRVGTVRYMSPEQALAYPAPLDHRTDIYSLGVTLYELLTLHPAFPGENVEQLLRRIAQEEPTRPRKLNPHVPEDLETIVLKAMAKSPQDRYATAQELVDDLHRYLETKPIRARRPTVRQRVGKWGRRHRSIVWSGVLLLVLAVAALAVGAALIWREKGRTEAALQEARTSALRAEQEAKKAKAEGRRAEREAQRARTVMQSFQDTLASMRSASSGDSRLTVRELFDKAAAEVGAKFAGQPLVEADIRMMLGNAYSAIQDYPAAFRQHSIAAELRWKLLGPEDRDTLEAISYQARDLGGQEGGQEVYYHDGSFWATYEQVYRQLLEVRRQVLGEEHYNTLRAMIGLGRALRNLGRLDEAEQLHNQALAICRRVLGDTAPDTRNAMGELVATYRAWKKDAEAEDLVRRMADDCKRKLGPEAPNTLTALRDLAMELHRSGKYPEAEQLHKEVLAARRRILTSDHPDTITSMFELAGSLAAQGKFSEAEPLHREVLEVRQRTLGKEHPVTLRAMRGLANFLYSRGRYAEEAPIRQEVLEISRRTLGQVHELTLIDMDYWAGCLRRQGRYAEAEQVLRQALEVRERFLGKEHRETLRCMLFLADSLAPQGAYPEAEDLDRKALATAQRVLGEKDFATIEGTLSLARILGSQDKHAEAEPLWRQYLAICRSIRGTDHPSTLKAISSLASCLEAQGKTDEAKQLRAEKAAIEAATKPASMPASNPAGKPGGP